MGCISRLRADGKEWRLNIKQDRINCVGGNSCLIRIMGNVCRTKESL